MTRINLIKLKTVDKHDLVMLKFDINQLSINSCQQLNNLKGGNQ